MTQSPHASTASDKKALAETRSSSATAKKKVLVVGATGFLGAKILRNLAHAANATVVAMSRKGAPSNESADVEWVRGDLMDPASLDRALQGVDVVVSSANSYMKGSLDTDFQGNKNLIEAAARANVSRFVFLSIVSCEAVSAVPHFHAKKVAEDLIKASGVPYVFVRAPTFLDQSSDIIAKGVKAGRFLTLGDKTTRWSYVLTDDLASYLAKAATFPGSEINNQTIDVGWRDGPKSQQEIADLVSEVVKKSLKVRVVPWLVFRVLARPVKLFSELGYDLIQMFLFFKKGVYVSNISKQEHFFGPAPSPRDAITRWTKSQHLIS
ncbi:SDR family oxidoreductase [Mesorhizobium onobrychidis]|uniref:SDR family oxidoreductase n=1 Tax=Mesorhizobium onobrychidis TaxID=2775404 RepID=A0ABY5QP98_9HYPH|nr:SDR family oxidoreductase [Mesorhizobium onobrychidis]UVC12828.1 SDR family oxidoreductase [Mesorhizobium onobrychidis]